MLSRFRSKAEQKVTLDDLAAGRSRSSSEHTVAIEWTCNSATSGCSFVDEEQRFGVATRAHQADAKESRRSDDDGDANPEDIEHVAGGIRDISIIETPPRDRLSSPDQRGQVRAAVISRGFAPKWNRRSGVFRQQPRPNRPIRSPISLRASCRSAVAVGHGQLDEEELERVMVISSPTVRRCCSARRSSRMASTSPRQQDHRQSC